MKAKLLKVLEKVRWVMMLFVTTNFQKKINKKFTVSTQYHFIVCLWLAVLLGSILSFVVPIWIPINIWIAIVIGVVSSTLIGVAYEFYQKYSKKGEFDPKDMLSDGTGSIAGGMLLTLIVVTLKAAEFIN